LSVPVASVSKLDEQLTLKVVRQAVANKPHYDYGGPQALRSVTSKWKANKGLNLGRHFRGAGWPEL
jgi:hypothetical protein